MSEYKTGTRSINRELADKIEILRFDEDGLKGFQRKLDMGRVRRMATELSNGGGKIVPPIIVGDLRGRLILIDGQHRLEAWKLQPYELEVKIEKMLDMNDARRAFVTINGQQKRVALKLKLAVDPSEYAMRLRTMAKKFNMGLPEANKVIVGLHGQSKNEVSYEEWDHAERIMRCWSSDRRWQKSTHIYSRGQVLEVITQIAKNSRDPESTLNEIKNMDFSMGGKLAKHLGAGNSHLKSIIYDHIAKRVLA